MAGSNKYPPDGEPEIDVEKRESTRGISPVLIGLIATVLVLLALIFVVGRGESNSSDDRLSDNGLAQADSSPQGLCSSRATYDLVRTALFRQAAQLRGSDQAAYERLSGFAFVRMEAPILIGEDKARGAISCSGSLTLELPPGLVVEGGRRTLSGEIDYVVQPAADGSGTAVAISHADGIVTPLATLSRTAVAAPRPAEPTDMADPLAPLTDGQVPGQPDEPVPVRPTANPSFDCNNARTRSELAVCSDPALATLDRQMASQFSRAMAEADAGERVLLDQTRARFLDYRDGCRSNDCIASAYRGRMREIQDIAAGTWQPPR